MQSVINAIDALDWTDCCQTKATVNSFQDAVAEAGWSGPWASTGRRQDDRTLRDMEGLVQDLILTEPIAGTKFVIASPSVV